MRRSKPKRLPITDDQIRTILLAPVEERGMDLALRLDLRQQTVSLTRRLMTPASLRVARELGLLSNPPKLHARWEPPQLSPKDERSLIAAIMAGDA